MTDKERFVRIKNNPIYWEDEDAQWLISTVETQQREIIFYEKRYQVRKVELLEEHIDRLEKEIERLQTIEQTYEALRKSL